MAVGHDAPDQSPHHSPSEHQSPFARIAADVTVIVREQVDYSELLRVIARRDLTVRYQNSVLGFGWAVFVPLLQMLIFTLVFTRLAPIDTGMPYPIYAYTGLLIWSWFASSLRFAGTSLISNPHLVTKVYFPREVLPFSAVLVAFFDFLVASIVLVGLMVYFDVRISWALGALPVIIVTQLVFTAAIALVVAMAHLFYADVKYVFELFLLLWMFASSVLYPLDRIGGTVGMVLRGNPMTVLIDAYRDVLLHGSWPAWAPLGVVALTSVLFLGVAWIAFHRAEYRFAEEI
jgi:lipopolysaccharide transport system permease protein